MICNEAPNSIRLDQNMNKDSGRCFALCGAWLQLGGVIGTSRFTPLYFNFKVNKLDE